MKAETEADEQKGFINLANYHEKYIKTSKVRVVESEISAYLPLQVLLFYHYYYYFLLFTLLASLFIYKSQYLGYANIWDVLVIIVQFLNEMLRIHFGAKGNTNESFSDLLAFVCLTLPISLLFVGYEFYLPKILFPLEYALCIVQVIFIIFEAVFSIIAIRKLVKNQTAIFFLRNSKPEIYNRVEHT